MELKSVVQLDGFHWLHKEQSVQDVPLHLQQGAPRTNETNNNIIAQVNRAIHLF